LLLLLPTLLTLIISGLGEVIRVRALGWMADGVDQYDTAQRAAATYLDRAARGQVPYDVVKASRMTRALLPAMQGELLMIDATTDWIRWQTRMTGALAVCQLAVGGWYWRRRARGTGPRRADLSVEKVSRAA
jgi:hypothetical protein